MYAYENEQKVHFKHKSYMKGSRNFSLEKLGVFRHLFSYALQYLLWFLSMGRRGTSARQQEEQEQEQEQEKKVWWPPATAESSCTASLARTTHTRKRSRNRFPGWGLIRSHPQPQF